MTDPYAAAILDAAKVATRHMRTVVPGLVSEVVSDDDRRVTATLETGIGELDIDGEAVSDGAVPAAPVLYPGGGGYGITWPLAAGDEVVGLCSDRSIERWRQSADAGRAPSLARYHSISDALILPVTMRASSGAEAQVGQDLRIFGRTGIGVTIRADGSVSMLVPGDPQPIARIEIAADGAIAVTPAAGKLTVVGDALLADALVKVQALETAMDAMLTALVAAGAGPAFAGASAAKTAWETSIDALPLGTTSLESS